MQFINIRPEADLRQKHLWNPNVRAKLVSCFGCIIFQIRLRYSDVTLAITGRFTKKYRVTCWTAFCAGVSKRRSSNFNDLGLYSKSRLSNKFNEGTCNEVCITHSLIEIRWCWPNCGIALPDFEQASLFHAIVLSSLSVNLFSKLLFMELVAFVISQNIYLQGVKN